MNSFLEGFLTFMGNLAGNINSLFNPSAAAASTRNEYLADREHTEMREDTSYQRAVKDMQAAGLNPYTIGASPANSSSSNVGELTASYRLQMLGNLLDVANLSLKNKKITNDSITSILGFFKK